MPDAVSMSESLRIVRYPIVELNAMATKRFWLKPFSPVSGGHRLDVVGRVSREKNLLTVSYELLGTLQNLISAKQKQQTVRNLSEACQNTCLECFVAPINSEQYWEFELVPDLNWIKESMRAIEHSSGWDFQVSSNHSWKVSHFHGYRQGAHVDHSIKTISYSMLSAPKALHTLLKVDLEKMLLADTHLAVGIAAVTHFNTDSCVHWALNHPNDRPDFHHRDSFALALQ